MLAPRADCGTAQQHSAGQRNPGLACWWRAALIGPGPAGWRTEDAEDVRLLQVGTQVGFKAGSEGRVEFESRGMSSPVRRVCAGGPPALSDGVEGQNPVRAVVTGCCKGSLCCPGRSPRGGQQRAACVGSTRQDRGRGQRQRERLCEAS